MRDAVICTHCQIYILVEAVARCSTMACDAKRTSKDQEAALQDWLGGKSVRCTAAAGSGKSFVLQQAVCRVDDECVVIAYNRALALHMTSALEESSATHAQCFTFHGLATYVLELTPDDTTLEDVVERAECGKLTPRVCLAPRRVLVDEAQDIRPLHLRLLRVALDLSAAQFFIVGDVRQLLYTYMTPPASPEYMLNAAHHFGGTQVWATHELSTSFRLTEPLAAFANVLLEGQYDPIVSGLQSAAAPVPVVFSCNNFDWTPIVELILKDVSAGNAPGQVAILVRSTRHNPPLLRLVNALSQRGWPLYVHGVDGSDDRVRRRKLTISTWHASKGTEVETAIVCGVTAESELRPLHVAVTRSSRNLYVLMDERNPRTAVLECITSGIARAGNEKTCKLAQRPPTSAQTQYRSACMREVTAWTPPSARDADECIEHIETQDCEQGKLDPLPPEVVVNVGGVYEDVTDLYVTAAMLCIEARQSHQIPCMVQDMLRPQRVSRVERNKRLRDGDRCRVVDMKAQDAEMLPPSVWDALRREVAGIEGAVSNGREARRWLTLALAVSAFAVFHHRARRLVDVKAWADASLFERIVERVLAALPSSDPKPRFDAVVVAMTAEHGLFSRVHIIADETAWLVVYTDRISASHRARACVPVALSADIRVGGVVSALTGSRALYRVRDREALLSLLE